MTDPDRPILLIAALDVELRPLFKRLLSDGWRLAPSAPDAGVAVTLRRADGDRPEITLCRTGMGADRARAAVARLLDELPAAPGRALIFGLAGALDPALAGGQVIAPDRVLDEAPGESLTPTWLLPDAGGVLVTADDLIGSPQRKAETRERTGADVVDMETAAIARVLETRSIPWAALRAVSDRADEALPNWLTRLTRTDGRTDAAAAARMALLCPWRLPRLIALGRRSARACNALASATLKFL